MTDKAQIRQQMRERRQQLGERERALAERRAASRLGRLRWLRSAERIALYVPSMGEMDLLHALPPRCFAGKKIFLPVLTPGRHPGLRFAPLPADRGWTVNRYGIPEPDVPACDWLPAARLDLVLAPLVAFDDRGNRLGMGGGYYDRALAHLARRRHWRRPRVAGIAFDFQRVKALPREPWDVALDAVITDGGVYLAGNTR